MPKTRKKATKQGAASTFKTAVQSTPSVSDAYQPGIQALHAEHRKGVRNATLATGSIDLDAALQRQFPSSHRWDYGIGLPGTKKAERVMWLEVHHAASGETERVIKKLQALKSWLEEHSPALNSLQRIFIWQLSNVENNPNDRRKRNLLAAKHGLRRVQGMLDLAAI